jgi:hypothetical protein
MIANTTKTKPYQWGSIIDNPDAYAKATKARIIANAVKTFCKTYADHNEIQDFLSLGRVHDDEGNFKCYKEGFVGSLASAFDNYGKLSEKQVEAVRKCIADRIARKAEWASKQALIDAARQHIGSVGEKITLTLTLKKVINLESHFGSIGLFIFEDAEKNVVIYKGNSSSVWELAEGEVATLKATVKEHGVRNGVKQTLIQRPKAV